MAKPVCRQLNQCPLRLLANKYSRHRNVDIGLDIAVDIKCSNKFGCVVMQRGRKSAAATIAARFLPVDGRANVMRPPASLSETERAIWIHIITTSKPEHFQPGDESLLKRFCEVSAAADIAAGKFRRDLAKGRPSPWLATQERLLKMLVVLCRQLRLSPLARTPHKNGRPEVFDASNGHGRVSAYERMALDDPQ